MTTRKLIAWSIAALVLLTSSPGSAALRPAQVAGSWEAVAVQYDGRVLEIDKDDGVVVSFVDGAEKTFKLAMALGPLRRVLTGTWRIEGDTLVMVDGETGEASRASVELRGPLLVLETDTGMTMILQPGDGS